MLGAGLQFARNRGEDRFYNSARARKSYLNKQNQENLRRAQSDVAAAAQSPSMKEYKPKREPGNQAAMEEQPKLVTVQAPEEEPVVSHVSNIERFLESVTPSVPAQYLSKTTMRGWRTCDAELQPHFVLDDLWESFKEWSAYGAGVPLILNDSDSVVQYYVPYLSGIQLYGDSSKSSVKSSRRHGEDSDGDYFRDSSSDGSSDCERSSLNNFSRDWNNPHSTTEIPLRIDRMSLRDNPNVLHEGFSSDESESGNSQGCLLFEYFERDPPYSREPLADKIVDFSIRFPELKTLRSCELLPSSWISVAWYPIYRIPTGPTLKDLDACFITFHSLHTPMTGTPSSQASAVTYASEVDGVPKISLPVFGLASYKLKVPLWTLNGERHLVNSLLQAAENWLTLLQVNHPDFLFFSRR